MSNYLIWEGGLVDIGDLQPTVDYLSNTEGIPKEVVLGALEGAYPGMQIYIPLYYPKGSIVATKSGNVCSIIDEYTRPNKIYFVVSPNITKEVKTEFLFMD